MQFNIFFRVILLYLFLSSTLVSGTPNNIHFFDDKPKSLVKDFYIYRYLQKSTTTSSEAWKLLEQTNHMSMKLFHAYANKLDEPGVKKVSRCLKMKLEPLLKSDNECLAIKFSPYYATLMDKKKLKEVKKRLSKYEISKSLHVIYSNNPHATMVKGDSKLFFDIFNKVGSKYRVNFLDYEISKEKIKELEKNSKINTTIKLTVTNRKLKNFNKSLIHIDRYAKTLSHESLFFLGLNALQLRYNSLAMAFFDEAYKRAYYRMDKDKILFWQFLVSKDKKYEKAIKRSFDLNIYTLLVGAKNGRIITTKASKKHPSYDETNPFEWVKLLRDSRNKTSQELEKIANTFLYDSTLPHFTYLMERASNYKDHYFPLPYMQYLKGADKQRIALIMAIARQESRFIPASVSTAYALGMMQFMPFLAKDIAKNEKMKNFDLDDMFNQKIALDFANIHLDWLENSLYHPLFIAYAYNGGIGFTKRLLQSNTFRKGKYEPLLSMELVYYSESRKYGKKVLANYVTYMHILGEPISIYELIVDLTDPIKTDKFRTN
ncbi:MAG: lytic transglycosylase domain-containing protein [Sulfurospirillum sp.]|nr:lytic transglycosylase domain-containing protein [Sulfurospirillum sp.]MBL0702738.1 lytic transglycosylase domain-containing protein [Sulfurospirillum sp.]